jgi:hypothetical protein
MAESEWSDLPRELLILISQRIDTEIDLIRFRSVCSNWRHSSSVSNHHLNLTIKFPLLSFFSILSFSPNTLYPYTFSDSINATNTSFCYLSKRSIFLIKPPQHQQQQTLDRPWLLRITQNAGGKTNLFLPLISYHSPSSSVHLPRLLDFNKLPVLHFGTDFIIDEEFIFHNKPSFNSNYMYPEKVISVGEKPVVIGILKGLSPQPVFFRCSDERWKQISDISTTCGDICLFKGRFYAVDKRGKTVTIGLDSSVELVAEHVVGGGDRKLLVESEGELLLVDIYECLRFSIEVFRFHENEKKWVKLKNLGDRVLFLGNGCSFSASASDLCVSKGNCVIFIDGAFLSSRNKQCGNCVFHLDQGRLSSMSHYPEYFNLFWPPPDWIFKS